MFNRSVCCIYVVMVCTLCRDMLHILVYVEGQDRRPKHKSILDHWILVKQGCHQILMVAPPLCETGLETSKLICNVKMVNKVWCKTNLGFIFHQFLSIYPIFITYLLTKSEASGLFNQHLCLFSWLVHFNKGR